MQKNSSYNEWWNNWILDVLTCIHPLHILALLWVLTRSPHCKKFHNSISSFWGKITCRNVQDSCFFHVAATDCNHLSKDKTYLPWTKILTISHKSLDLYECVSEFPCHISDIISLFGFSIISTLKNNSHWGHSESVWWLVLSPHSKEVLN